MPRGRVVARCQRARGGAPAVTILIVAVLLLTGCSTTTVLDRATPSSTPLRTGAFASIPPVATSYDSLGAFGRYARALDTEYRLKPSFTDWDVVANQNCAAVEKGDTESMAEPSSFNGNPDDEVLQDGILIHPTSGKIWAAALSSRCPALFTDAVKARMEVEQTAGVTWVRAQR